MIDYPDATGLQGIAANLYQDGGVVGAVCHGAAIFPGIVDESGKSIVWGKRVTGFTAKGEEEEGVLGTVREWPAIRGWESGTVEDVVKEAGATCESVVDGSCWAAADLVVCRCCASRALGRVHHY